MTTELPQMSAHAHSHSLYDASHLQVPVATSTVSLYEPMLATPAPEIHRQPHMTEEELRRRVQQAQQAAMKGPQEMPQPTLRLVQIFIADTDPMVPLAERLLHQTAPTVTDLTDQELFYDLPIRDILDAHNAKRVKLYDKRVKDRTQMLEPLRIRDLKMNVVTIALF